MTPELPNRSSHLTEEQFADLIAASSPQTVDGKVSAAHAHILECEQCTAELESLRTSLSLFRDATTAYAHNQLCTLKPLSAPVRRPLLNPAWFVAAAALLLTALLPIRLLHRQPAQQQPAVTAAAPATPSTESDEALLEDVNRETAAAVPAPMQALADPATNFSKSSSTSDPRKD